MMAAHWYDRLSSFAEEKRLKENLALVTALWSIVLGLSITFDPTGWTSAPSLHIAGELAAQPVWGAAFILAGVAPLFSFRDPGKNYATAWFLRGLTILCCAMSVTFALSKVYYGGALTGVVAYLLPAAVAGILAAVYRNAEG